MSQHDAKKPSVLLINACHDPDDEGVPHYLALLEPHFEVALVHLDAMTSSRFQQDAVVVTGSKKLITRDEVPATLYELYRETEKPLLGICYGHQSLAHAWGAGVILRELFEGDATIRASTPDSILRGLDESFPAFKSHCEQVVPDGKLTRHFDLLAYSDTCPVEVIRHRTRPLWGTQFHPERSGETGRRIAANFSRIAALARSNPRGTA